MDATHKGCKRGTYDCRSVALVRRGKNRGCRKGNIDDSLLHCCLICFVVEIIILSERNNNFERQAELCRVLLLSYAMLYFRERQNNKYLVNPLLSVSLNINYPLKSLFVTTLNDCQFSCYDLNCFAYLRIRRLPS